MASNLLMRINDPLKINELPGTTWVVPYSTLYGYIYSGSYRLPILDQTIWVFDPSSNNPLTSGENNHYVFGKCYAYLNGEYSSQIINGSITPTGKVQLCFFNPEHATSIIGSGNLKKDLSGKTYFEMQVNTTAMMHWSYMLQAIPGEELYEDVPGMDGLSVPEFIANCPPL